MSKKNKLRDVHIEMIVVALPKSFYEIISKIKMTGEEVLASGTREIDGKRVELGKTYTYGMVVPQPLNHARRLKKLYDIHGDNCLKEYMKWFKPHHAAMVEKYPQLFINISKTKLDDQIAKFL